MLLHGDIWFGFIIKLIIIRKYGDNINYALKEVFTRFTNLNEFFGCYNLGIFQMFTILDISQKLKKILSTMYKDTFVHFLE